MELLLKVLNGWILLRNYKRIYNIYGYSCEYSICAYFDICDKMLLEFTKQENMEI